MTQARRGTSCVVLAAGYGKRMNSELPKVLHRAAGRPLLVHVLAAIRPLPLDRVVLVVPPDHDSIRAIVAQSGLGDGVDYAVQERPAGTADAAKVGLAALPDRDGDVLVLPGDHPLLEAATLVDMLETHQASGCAATILTCRLTDPSGRGRIVRGEAGEVLRIVEDKDASPEQLDIDEINGGIYVFDAAKLGTALDKIDRQNAQGEYYATDAIEILHSQGEKAIAFPTTTYDAFGVNSRSHLAQSGALLRRRACERWMEEGVTIIDPSTTYIDVTATIGADAVVHPFTFIEGNSSVGAGAEVGPNSRIVDSTIGERARVTFAVVRESVVGADASVGPYASLRPGTQLENGAHVGTFVETKNSRIGAGSKVPHLSYIGDATIGKGVNIGAGTITCNWDGEHKHETVIEDDAYVSSDTMLVAPVHIGERGATGAGAVVRGDVPADALAVGVPARIISGRGNKMKRSDKASD